MLIWLAGCSATDVQVWGDDPPVVPEGFTTVAAELSADVPSLELEVPEGVDKLAWAWSNDGLHSYATDTPPADEGLPGTWTFDWMPRDDKERPVNVWVQHYQDTTPESGVLTVQVVFTRSYVDDTEAQDEIREALGYWQDAWEPQGITIEPYYQYTDARGACRFELGQNVVHEGITAAGADHDITLVICPRFPTLGSAVGFAFPNSHAPALSVVGVVPIRAGAQVIAQTMAHEVGHAAGLAHAEEDELDDTPPCPEEGSCAETLGSNFMYSSALCGSSDGEERVDNGSCWLQSEMSPLQRRRLLDWIGIR